MKGNRYDPACIADRALRDQAAAAGRTTYVSLRTCEWHGKAPVRCVKRAHCQLCLQMVKQRRALKIKSDPELRSRTTNRQRLWLQNSPDARARAAERQALKRRNPVVLARLAEWARLKFKKNPEPIDSLYIIRRLRKGVVTIGEEDIPPELIELYRSSLKLKRLIKELK